VTATQVVPPLRGGTMVFASLPRSYEHREGFASCRE
jgi:hypothetical protein